MVPPPTAGGVVEAEDKVPLSRQLQAAALLTLGELREAQVDMFTTVFIGSAATRRIGDRMVTPRGYEL